MTGWILGKKGLDQINKGSYWKLPKWYYTLFIQVAAPVLIIGFLVGYVVYLAGGGAVLGNSLKNIMSASPWTMAGQIVVLAVLVLGVIQTNLSIRKKYPEEIAKNTVLVVKE